MFTKIDKAYAAALVSFLSTTALQFWGLEINEQVQAGIAALIVFAATWRTPNKA